MDLLAGYNDDGENSQTPEKRASGELYGSPKEGAIVGVPPPANLDSEWENFEKLLAGSAYGGGDSTSAEIHIESTGYMISEDDGQDRAVPKAYALTGSRSRSKSRSHSHSSGSSASSRSSSADSQKGKKGKRSSSSSEEAPDKEEKTDTTDVQEKALTRSPPIKRKERSATPVEKRKSKSRSKSRSVERHKGSRHKSRSRSRSRGRHGHSRSARRHRRSRSRGHEGKSRRSRSKRHRSRSHDNHRHSRRRKSHDRSRSRDRNDKRGHQRRRRRSRSHGRDERQRSPKRDHGRYRDEKVSTFRGHEPSKPTFKEKMRQQLMKASKMLTEKAQAGQLPPEGERPLVASKEKPSDLPLNLICKYPNMAIAGTVTPQMALIQTMAVMHQKAQEMTGIAVPKYYNPAAVNPLKYAEQVQKRKLLWSKSNEKKEDTQQAVWQGTNFNADNDGKVNAKFRKLMGMKEGETEAQEADAHNEDINRKQQELFHKLDQQYEFARMTTHTHRGIGLGFQSQGMPDT